MKYRHPCSPLLRAMVCCLALTAIASAHSRVKPAADIVTAPTADTPSGPLSIPAPTVALSKAGSLPVGTKPALNTIDYAAVAGDSWTTLAEKFNTTRKTLKGLNHLASDKLAPGQIIQVPAPARARRHYLSAQPVQDFDVPASTFASCPVPVVTDTEDEVPMPAPVPKTAPVAELVSPVEMAQDQKSRDADDRLTLTAPAPKLSLPPAALPASKLVLAPSIKPAVVPGNGSARRTVAAAKMIPTQLPAYNPPAPKLASHGFLSGIFGNAAAANDWGARFLVQARQLGDRGIEYDEDWRPPGEARPWTMDCSNTSRYLYKSVANINLPRTASDQYYYLHLQGKAWDVPANVAGLPDGQYLRAHLQPGDLLFWENTYRPERQPPITHVMVFLGTNEHGEWIMAGSQSSRGGEHNRRNGGPDVYVFRPSQPCGGYTTWLGMVRHQGRFCAFGRPLDADPSKFALND